MGSGQASNMVGQRFAPQQQQQQQQYAPQYQNFNQQQNQWVNNNNVYGNNGQQQNQLMNGYRPSFNPSGQNQYGQFNNSFNQFGQPQIGPQNFQSVQNAQAGNPFADLNQAWFDAEQARNRYVQLAGQLNDQAYLSYINQNPQYTPNNQQNMLQGPLSQAPVVMNQQQTQQITPPPFVNSSPLNNPVTNNQSPFPQVVPDNTLPNVSPSNEPLLEEAPAPPVTQAPLSEPVSDVANQPVPSVEQEPLAAPVAEAPAPVTDPNLTAQQPAPAPVNEDMQYYNELSQKPTEELQGMLRSILSLPAEGAQGQVDEKLYSLQTIEYILDIVKDRPDAATPQTFGLLKELGEMSKVMATMPGADIPQWKREDSKIIWMETLWAAAKLDSMLDNIAVKKLPGFSTMIEPILSGKEEVPPLILMAATQAVSPDVFKYSNDPSVQSLLKKVEARATKAVNRSGRRKWYTAGIGKYKKLSQNEMQTYQQVAQYANAIRNGQGVSQMPASGGMPPANMNSTAGMNGYMPNAAEMANFDPSKIDPAMLQQMQAEMDAELSKMSPEERQQFQDAIASVAQEAIQSGALNGQTGGAQPSQAEIDALLASLGQPQGQTAATSTMNAVA